MTKSNKKNVEPLAEETSPPAAEAEEEMASPPPEAGPPAAGALVEAPEEAVRRLTDEVEEMRDRHLRLAADFDNFRKRISRERTETWARAQADVVSKILDALDDLGRVAHVDLSQADATDILSGVELVERKLLRELESAGLERVGQADEPFDPNVHEALGTMPAEGPDRDHTVGEVVQIGYRFGGALLRPARVMVRTWTGGGD